MILGVISSAIFGVAWRPSAWLQAEWFTFIVCNHHFSITLIRFIINFGTKIWWHCFIRDSISPRKCLTALLLELLIKFRGMRLNATTDDGLIGRDNGIYNGYTMNISPADWSNMQDKTPLICWLVSPYTRCIELFVVAYPLQNNILKFSKLIPPYKGK